MAEPDEIAHAYREGFLEGARAVIAAIGDDLPEQQMRVLEKWTEGSLQNWLKAGADASPPPLPMLDGA